MGAIGLLDCNNFFVSCERLFRPDLVGKPVAVLSSNDGCIVARSQEVKDMGIPMGLPLFQVKQLVDVSQITFFSSNFALYRDISSRVMQTLAEEVGPCEVYSIDEAFFNVRENVTEEELMAIRGRLMQKTGIPVSIGIAPTKTIAKAASKLAKKQGGVKRLKLEDWQTEAASYPLGDVWNLGRATLRSLGTFGVTSVTAFIAADPLWVDSQFGVMGRRLQDELRGMQIYNVSQNSDTLRQSLASTRSFAKATNEQGALESAVAYHLTHVAEKLRQQKLVASWLIIELRASRHGDFAYRKGSVVVELSVPTNTTTELLKEAIAGMAKLYEHGVPYKKAGVVAGGLMPESFVQPNLFETVTTPSASRTVDTVTDLLNQRFGPGTVRPGNILDSRPKTSAALRSPHYTTSWNDIPTIAAKHVVKDEKDKDKTRL